MKLIMKKEHFEQIADGLLWVTELIDNSGNERENYRAMMLSLVQKGSFNDDNTFINNALRVTFNKVTNEVMIEIDGEKVDAVFTTAKENKSLIKITLKSLYIAFDGYISLVTDFCTNLGKKFSDIGNKRLLDKELAKEFIVEYRNGSKQYDFNQLRISSSTQLLEKIEISNTWNAEHPEMSDWFVSIARDTNLCIGITEDELVYTSKDGITYNRDRKLQSEYLQRKTNTESILSQLADLGDESNPE